PDTDTGSCRPRLFRSFSFCRHTLHIAVDCKHPADTKLKNLGETLYFGTIALEAQPTGHTFLPITREVVDMCSRGNIEYKARDSTLVNTFSALRNKESCMVQLETRQT